MKKGIDEFNMKADKIIKQEAETTFVKNRYGPCIYY